MSFSAEEYFGASLWQLYKSVDSPYKAVLKKYFIGSLFADYPNGKLLALEMKQHLHRGEIVNYGLDAYCMMLERNPLFSFD